MSAKDLDRRPLRDKFRSLGGRMNLRAPKNVKPQGTVMELQSSQSGLLHRYLIDSENKLSPKISMMENFGTISQRTDKPWGPVADSMDRTRSSLPGKTTSSTGRNNGSGVEFS